MLCLKLSSVYFQSVNEQAAHVKIDGASWAVVILLFLLLSDGFQRLGFYE